MSIEKIHTDGQELKFPNRPLQEKSENTLIGKNHFRPIYDINDIDEDLRHYFEKGIDVQNSYSQIRNNEVVFNLAFNPLKGNNLSVNGSYFFQQNKIKTNINFFFTKQVEEEGEIKNKLFEFSYNLEAEHIYGSRKEKKEEKEDILSFVRRISHKIYQLAGDDNLKLRSVYLDQEDMNDIIYFEDEKGRAVLMELINLIILTARLKQSENKNKEDFEADYLPERKKTEKEEVETFSINKFNTSLSIKEVETENSEEKKDE